MPFFNAWKKNLLRYLETWIGVSVGIFLLGGLCLGVPMLIEATSDYEPAPFLLIGGAAAFLIIVFGGVAIYAALVLRTRRNRLNLAFALPNISGRSYSTNGRQYHGLFRNRQMDSYYFRGPTLDIYLSTPLQTRAGIGPRNALGSLFAGIANRAPLPMADAAYKDFDAFADDSDWAAKWFGDEETKSAMARLLRPADDAEWRLITMQPGSIRLTLRYTEEKRITSESVQQWLEDLSTLLGAAERLTAPVQPSAPLSALERMSQENRGAFTLPAFLIVVGALLIPTICIIVALVVVVTMPSAR